MPDIDLISSKLEDYLEAIARIVAERRVARVSDIAQTMGVQMPTVTGALRHLAEHGLVNYEPYQFVTLTSGGAAIAHRITRRHGILKRFLTDVLGVPEDAAERDACGMEHSISQKSLDRLTEFVEQQAADTAPRRGKKTTNGH